MKRKYITKADLLVVLHYLGYIMQGLGVVLLAPILVALIYGEYIKVSAFLIPCFISFLIGTAFTKKFSNYNKLRLKHGMLISSFAWLWASLIGASIMALSLDIHFVDALFENMSAWTGSGMTFFVNVEILPKSILFLRSLEQWIGGLGIVIIFIGILIRSGTAASRLYKSEAREEKIKPNIANTLRKALEIYLIYTAAGIILFILAGLPIFDAVNLTFTSISTGGMSIKNANVGFYNDNIVYIITMILMLLGATSFTVHYNLVKTKGKSIINPKTIPTISFIPNIFKIVCKLATEYNIPYIRTQYEKFYTTTNKSKTYSINFGINIIKNLLLKFFTLINRNTIKKYKLKTNKFIIGICYTGMMDSDSIKYGLEAIKNDCVVEA